MDLDFNVVSLNVVNLSLEFESLSLSLIISIFFFFIFQCQRCKSLFPTVEASEHHASLCYKNAPLIKLHLRDIDSLIHQQNNQEKVLPKAAFIISREISGCTVRTVSDGQDRIKPIRAAPNSGLVTQERLTYQHCGICSKAVSGKN